ncbi:MAG: citramalate synthase [Deltaproteobacteria bacterium]|nr:citramalate synthase [Deltaproteobacteria bacterium]
MKSNLPQIELYDTTLRDGTQSQGFVLSVEDKLRAAERLDRLGVAFIEGGWPGSNPRDREFFARVGEIPLKHARIVAFGSTHHAGNRPDNDPNLAEILNAGTRVVTLVGKCWALHVTTQLGTSLEHNLEMVRGSVAHLKAQGREVLFDAEHFFNSMAGQTEYALAVLDAAVQGGAGTLVLCDTNGGYLPSQVAEMTRAVAERFPDHTLGIHCHNDSECAVASTLAAVEAGARQVQGTMGGVGERCGNANLCSIIPALELKMGFVCLPPGQLPLLSETFNFIQELANLRPNPFTPYVGSAAFSHKGGLHISAVEKDPAMYEHVAPETVGNRRRYLVSDLAGKAAVLRKSQDWGLGLTADDPRLSAILAELKERENEGFHYEAAEASFELLMHRAMGREFRYFDLMGFRVTDYKDHEGQPPLAEATVLLLVDGKVEHTAALGQGPVNALDRAIRKALVRFYPQLVDMRLVDYKVRVLSSADGTAARVRVLIESTDGRNRWGTVGVSFDVLEASWQALGDSIRFKLFKDSIRER